MKDGDGQIYVEQTFCRVLKKQTPILNDDDDDDDDDDDYYYLIFSQFIDYVRN